MKNVCAELEVGSTPSTAPATAPRNNSQLDGNDDSDKVAALDSVNNTLVDCVRTKASEDGGFSTNESDVALTSCAQQKLAVVNNCVQVAPVFSNGSSGSIAYGGSNESTSQDTCCSVGETSGSCEEEEGAKSKRKGIAGFLPKNIFHWRTSTERLSSLPADFRTIKGQCCNVVTCTQCSCSNCTRDTSCHSPKVFNQERYRDCYAVQGPVSSTRSKRSDDLVANSTMALILENRPLNLPAKPPEEMQRHKQQYEQMIEAAKKKEIKVAKLKKKQVQQQLKYENQLSTFAKVWNQEVLPNWETIRNTRRTRDLWWQGIPPSVRGKVWKLAIGNELNITPELYEICVSRAKDRIKIALESASISEEEGVFLEETSADKEASVDLIKLDVSRTFPQLCIFQKGGPYYDILHSLLGAYVCYRPDVGYVQGMSFLAAVLILNMDVADAFVCFTNLLNKPCHLAFFRLDEPMMKCYFLTYEEFFRENMPRLFIHFQKHNLSPNLYLIDWIYTLYSRSLPLDVACRVWDVFLRDGEEFLFRTALGILHLYEDILIKLEFIHLAQYLTRLPDDISADLLFKSIDCVKMITEKRRFTQVLMLYTDPRGS